VGPLIVFAKRRILLPLTRWLYEYSLENFKRQQAINRLLYAVSGRPGAGLVQRAASHQDIP
jgi:hypothetical protein